MINPVTAEMATGNRGSVIIVTGASQGLGYAISMELLRRQVSVIGVARSDDLLSTMAGAAMAEARGNARFFPCVADVTTAHGVAAVKATLGRTGLLLMGLINNAGTIEPIAPLATVSTGDWRKQFDVNLFAVVELTQQFLPMLRLTNGRVINISSGAATRAYQGWSAYCVSKAAVNMFTQSLAEEEPEIVAMAVRPGVMDTKMQEFIRKEGKDTMHPDDYEKFTKLHEDEELLSPEKPAYVIARLALEASRDLSGKFFSWDSAEVARFRSQQEPMYSYNAAGNAGSSAILPPPRIFGP
ncbi:hypothetical protein GGF43_000585 [Coemansia sp. RSA 2618]|nr:hypothetical protein GGF43_000585 [Coemansia sp. RSA 2618]